MSVRGTLRVPGDKSISHRAALFNALGDGVATIRNFSSGADCSSTLACLGQLGVNASRDDECVNIVGRGLRGLSEPTDVLDCGNSGTTMRLLSGILAGAQLFAVLRGDDSLRRRPMARVVEPLRRAGAHIEGRDRGRLPPLAISPALQLKGVEHRPEVASAQVKSALLLSGLFADGPTSVVEPAPTRDHTERLLRAMGASVSVGRRADYAPSPLIKPLPEVEGFAVTIDPPDGLRCVDVEVPGDFSSAAFWLVFGVLHPDAEVRVDNVGINPTRTGLLTILQNMGANVEIDTPRDVAGEPVGDLVARSSELHGITVDGALVPLAIDEISLVALLGLFAEGETVVKDASELRAKESDRLAVVAEGLRALGGDVDVTEDGWRIRPSRLKFGHADSHGDHRMAMLFALAGALGKGADIAGAESVAISYPTFWTDLETLSAS